MNLEPVRITRPRSSPERQAQLLDELERRPGSVIDFAAQHGISTATLFRWRRRRRAASSSAGNADPGTVSLQRVSLAQVLGAGGLWAGEVQLPDGTQVRWGAQPPVEVLLQVLTCLRRPC